MQRIHESVWIAPGAQLYGRIEIGEGSSVWPHCVIRSECHEVRIGRARAWEGADYERWLAEVRRRA